MLKLSFFKFIPLIIIRMILVVQQLSDDGRTIYDYDKLFFKFCLSKYLEEPVFYE